VVVVVVVIVVWTSIKYPPICDILNIGVEAVLFTSFGVVGTFVVRAIVVPAIVVVDVARELVVLVVEVAVIIIKIRVEVVIVVEVVQVINITISRVVVQVGVVFGVVDPGVLIVVNETVIIGSDSLDLGRELVGELVALLLEEHVVHREELGVLAPVLALDLVGGGKDVGC